MGFYNRLHTTIQCTSCQDSYPGIIQFKFGKTFQLDYQIGETIVWSDGDLARPGLEEVKVYGILETEECQFCKAKNELEFDIIVKRDVIMNVIPIVDMREYLEGDGDYIIYKQ